MIYFEQRKQQRSAYQGTPIRRRKRRIKTLCMSLRNVTIGVYPSALQRKNTEAEQNLQEQVWECRFQRSWSKKWAERLPLKVKKVQEPHL